MVKHVIGVNIEGETTLAMYEFKVDPARYSVDYDAGRRLLQVYSRDTGNSVLGWVDVEFFNIPSLLEIKEVTEEEPKNV